MKLLIKTCLTPTILCSELKVKQYKELLKTTYGEEPNIQIFLETLWDILAELTGKQKIFFKQINIIDLLLVVLQIRIASQGDACDIILTHEGKKANVEMKLDCCIEDIQHTFCCNLEQTISYNGVDIIIGCPSSERLLETTEEDYLHYIKEARFTLNGETAHVNIEHNTRAKQIFEQLPPHISMRIFKYVTDFNTIASELNLLDRYGCIEQTINFMPSLESLMWFTKLLFSESLEGFYNNVFYLSYLGHMNAEYIENCTPGEYLLFTQTLQNNLNTNNQTDSSSPTEEQFQDEVGEP